MRSRSVKLDAAERLNNEIAEHPARLMGYLLAMSDTTAVREAIKMLEGANGRRGSVWKEAEEVEAHVGGRPAEPGCRRAQRSRRWSVRRGDHPVIVTGAQRNSLIREEP